VRSRAAALTTGDPRKQYPDDGPEPVRTRPVSDKRLHQPEPNAELSVSGAVVGPAQTSG